MRPEKGFNELQIQVNSGNKNKQFFTYFHIQFNI